MAHAVASESNSTARKVDDAKSSVIGWAFGVLTSIALIVAGYSMRGVSSLETRAAVTETNQVVLQKSLDEIKAQQKESISEIKIEQKEMRHSQEVMNSKLERIADAVGAKRP